MDEHQAEEARAAMAQLAALTNAAALCLERGARALSCAQAAPAMLCVQIAFICLMHPRLRLPAPLAVAANAGFVLWGFSELVRATSCVDNSLGHDRADPCRNDSDDPTQAVGMIALWWVGGAVLFCLQLAAGAFVLAPYFPQDNNAEPARDDFQRRRFARQVEPIVLQAAEVKDSA